MCVFFFNIPGGCSVLQELSGAQQSLGYCPQFDALFDELTAREHLQLFTRLRGVPWREEKQVRILLYKMYCHVCMGLNPKLQAIRREP